MTKKDKFFELLIELINNQDQQVDEKYMDKVVQAMKSYVDIFVKPTLEGKLELCPITFTKTKEETPNNNFAGIFLPDKVKIEVYTSRLLTAKDRNERNTLLIKLFSTASHEVRHFMQWKYQQLLDGGDMFDNYELFEFLEKKLGEKALEMAETYADYGRNNKYLNVGVLRNFLAFLGKLDLIEMLSYEANMRKEDTVQYWLREIEQDARKIGRKSQQKLLKEFNGYVKKLGSAYKFPRNFDAVKKIKIDRFMKYGRMDQEELDGKEFPKYLDIRNSVQKREKASLRKLMLEREEIEQTVDQNDQASKDMLERTRETFEAICKVSLNEIYNEDRNASTENRIQAMIGKMKKVTADDLVRYAQHISQKNNGLEIFGQTLSECVEYGNPEFRSLENMQKIENLLEEEKLWDMAFVVEMWKYKLHPETREDELLEKINNKTVTVQDLAELVFRLEEEQDPDRGRIFNKLLRMCVEKNPETFAKKENLKELRNALGGFEYVWASMNVRVILVKLFPEEANCYDEFIE